LALSAHPEVHHLSTNPLCADYYPHARPLAIPGPAAQLPYAASIFSSISALSIASLLASSSLPTLLRECHRILTVGGSLHLTLLDPSPVAATLGPHLRSWLDAHLLLNLERQFRCVHPTRLFPLWLADCELRGDGSTISKVRFHASVASFSSSSNSNSSRFNLQHDDDDRDRDRDSRERKAIKLQLKSHVGRMLWKEIWGPFVEGDKWWWDDEMVVEECERLATVWEYAVIEAVKES
jgi:hypothetical protein